LDCPDPNDLYNTLDMKPWKKKSIVYREAGSVHVYERNGALVPVDELQTALVPGNAIVANVSLNLCVVCCLTVDLSV
jgi:hypothetical protein